MSRARSPESAEDAFDLVKDHLLSDCAVFRNDAFYAKVHTRDYSTAVLSSYFTYFTKYGDTHSDENTQSVHASALRNDVGAVSMTFRILGSHSVLLCRPIDLADGGDFLESNPRMYETFHAVRPDERIAIRTGLSMRDTSDFPPLISAQLHDFPELEQVIDALL